MLKRGEPVSFTVSKLKIWEWDVSFKPFGDNMILIHFWKKKKKFFPKNWDKIIPSPEVSETSDPFSFYAAVAAM